MGKISKVPLKSVAVRVSLMVYTFYIKLLVLIMIYKRLKIRNAFHGGTTSPRISVFSFLAAQEYSLRNTFFICLNYSRIYVRCSMETTSLIK